MDQPGNRSGKRIAVLIGFVAAILLVTGAVFLLRHQPWKKAADPGEAKHDPALPFYSSLSRKEQILFEEVRSSAKEHLKDGKAIPHAFTGEEVERVFRALESDDPMLFYLDFGHSVCRTNGMETTISLAYLIPVEEIDEKAMQLEAVGAALSAYVAEMTEDFEKELFFHDTLIDKCTFSDSADGLGNTAFGALVSHSADSFGYAKAMNFLLVRNGIESRLVSGSVGEGKAHCWNLVRVDGVYAHLDAAWDDPDLETESIRFHGYFNLTDDEMALDHVCLTEGLPSCGEEIGYYRKMGFAVSSREELEAFAAGRLLHAAEENEIYFEIFPLFDIDEEELRQFLVELIDRNQETANAFLHAVRIFGASETSSACTVRLYKAD